MRRSDAKAALEAARQWQQRGLLRDGALTTIESELGPVADEATPSLAMQSFYAIGGVMLGAASAALFALLELNGAMSGANSAWWFFLIFAILFSGAAIGTRMAGQPELADALAIASLVPIAILMGPEPITDWLYFVPVLACAGIMSWRRDGHLVPLLALGVMSVAIPIAYYNVIGDDWTLGDSASWAWLITATAVFAGVVAWTRLSKLRWEMEGLAATTLAVSAAWINVVAEAIEPSFDGGYEVVIAIGLAVLIGVGLLLKERVIVFVSGIALAIDAIVFAFDVGGPEVGLTVLLLMAGGLIATATLLRRRKGRIAASP